MPTTCGTERLRGRLQILCKEIEGQLKSKLESGVSDLVSGFLPQVWVFETESGAYSIHINKDGTATVKEVEGTDRDVTLRWHSEALISVLEARGRSEEGVAGYPDVLVQTDKGRAGFNYLKKEFGL